jgi:hypothetical protein
MLSIPTTRISYLEEPIPTIAEYSNLIKLLLSIATTLIKECIIKKGIRRADILANYLISEIFSYN